MEKLRARDCSLCGERFQPQTQGHVYCSPKCRERAKTIKKRQSQPLEDRRCIWCGNRLDLSMRAHALYCGTKCRKQAHSSRPCLYCGLPADSRDHFIPKSFIKKMELINPSLGKKQVIVPACLECNTLAGNRVFGTIAEKRNYIHIRLREKYAKVIEAPNWSKNELDQLGYTLGGYVRSGQQAKVILNQRLKWKARLSDIR